MSPVNVLALADDVCFPRVSGDEPPYVLVLATGGPFSPRERG